MILADIKLHSNNLCGYLNNSVITPSDIIVWCQWRNFVGRNSFFRIWAGTGFQPISLLHGWCPCRRSSKPLLSTVLIFRRPGRHRRVKTKSFAGRLWLRASPWQWPLPWPAVTVAARAQGRLGSGVAHGVSSPTTPPCRPGSTCDPCQDRAGSYAQEAQGAGRGCRRPDPPLAPLPTPRLTPRLPSRPRRRARTRPRGPAYPAAPTPN